MSFLTLRSCVCVCVCIFVLIKPRRLWSAYSIIFREWERERKESTLYETLFNDSQHRQSYSRAICKYCGYLHILFTNAIQVKFNCRFFQPNALHFYLHKMPNMKILIHTQLVSIVTHVTVHNVRWNAYNSCFLLSISSRWIICSLYRK